MVMMYQFAFWFSTRFGSLVVATLTLIQSITALTFCIVWIENQDKVKDKIGTWLRENDMRFMTGTLHDMERDPESYLVGFIVYLSLHCFACVLLLYGSLKVLIWLVYPFLILEIARLVFLTINFIIAMLLVKENVMNLGFLISCCCGGGFLLLFLYYLWFCTLSFVQIVKELEFVYKMGHFQGGKLNLHEYQRMNVPELGAEYFRRDEGFAQAADYRHPYNKKYIDDKLHARFNPESNYPDVLARPVF